MNSSSAIKRQQSQAENESRVVVAAVAHKYTSLSSFLSFLYPDAIVQFSSGVTISSQTLSHMRQRLLLTVANLHSNPRIFSIPFSAFSVQFWTPFPYITCVCLRLTIPFAMPPRKPATAAGVSCSDTPDRLPVPLWI